MYYYSLIEQLINILYNHYTFIKATLQLKIIVTFSVVGSSICNGLSLTLCSLPRTLSQAFLSQHKKVLFGHAGVGVPPAP